MDLDAMDSHFQEVENIENVPIDRPVLHLLAKHGSLKPEELKFAYQQSSLYPERLEWLNIAFRFFMGVGVLLTLSGVIFFFAYNWSDLHKFAKLGLVQGAILGIGLWLSFYKPSEFVTKLGLTAISVLVGVAFAVYGQIYQTGADAYDFFLGWTVFVTAWVAIASFPFLWLFYLILINVTLTLYMMQVHGVQDENYYLLITVVLNSVALLIWEYVAREDRENWVQLFCTRLVGLGVLSLVTIAMTLTIFDAKEGFGIIYTLLYLLWIIGGSIFYARVAKDIAFVAMNAISVLIMLNELVIKMMDHSSDSGAIFFLLSFLNIGATTFLVLGLIKLNKQWTEEKLVSYE